MKFMKFTAPTLTVYTVVLIKVADLAPELLLSWFYHQLGQNLE